MTTTAGKLLPHLETIREMYYVRNMTQDEIAVALRATQRGVFLFMRRHGMKTRPRIKRNQFGEKNDTWKGEAISYKGAHDRVARMRGKPKHCEDCGADDPDRRYDWANISGRYHDPNDYARLCRSCHCIRDGLIRNLGTHAKEPRHV